MAPAGQRFNAVMEVLVHELLQERIIRSRAPSSVSITSLRDSKGRRRQVGHQQGVVALDLPRSMGASLSKSVGVGDIAATSTGPLSDMSAGTIPKGSTRESALTAGGGSSSELLTGENAAEPKERCKTRCTKALEHRPQASVPTPRHLNPLVPCPPKIARKQKLPLCVDS